MFIKLNEQSIGSLSDCCCCLSCCQLAIIDSLFKWKTRATEFVTEGCQYNTAFLVNFRSLGRRCMLYNLVGYEFRAHKLCQIQQNWLDEVNQFYITKLVDKERHHCGHSSLSDVILSRIALVQSYNALL
jgi:hypothetical protein